MEIRIIKNSSEKNELLKNIADFRAALLIQHIDEMPYSSEKKKELLKGVIDTLKNSDPE